jgi:hypothetical protein
MKKAGKIIALSLLGLLALSLIATLAFAQETSGPFSQFFGEKAKAIFSQWVGGQLNANIAKILLFMLIAIVIFSIGKRLPFLEQKMWITGSFALIAAFLATAYITPQEVFGVLTAWSGMGITLGIIIPFAILIFFTIDTASTTEVSAATKLSNMVLAYFTWIVFIVVIAYRLIWSMATETQVSSASWVLALVVLGLGIAMLALLPMIFREIAKVKSNVVIEAAEATTKEGTAHQIAEARAEHELAERQRLRAENIRSPWS